MSSTPEIPSLRSLGPRFILDGLAPQAVFLALNTRFGLRWGIAGATLVSLGLGIYRKIRHQSIGWILPVSVAFILLRAAAGIVSRSDAVYFGPGIANNFIIGGAFIGSVFIGKPIVGLIAPTFYRFTDEAKRHPLYRKVCNRLTLLWGTYTIVMGVFQWWLLVTATTNQFVVIRALIGWPTTIALMAFSLWYPRRELRELRRLRETEELGDAETEIPQTEAIGQWPTRPPN